MAPSKQETKNELPIPALIVAALVGLGVIGMIAWQKFGPKPETASLITPEAKAYTRNLKLADVDIKATASYVGGELVEMTGKITNAGDRPVKQVDLNCVFYSAQGLVILRERVSIVRPKEGPLEPGQTRSFRMPFDSIPANWSRTPPQLVIAGIDF